MKLVILFFSMLLALNSYSQYPSIVETQIVSPEPIIRPKYHPPVKEYVTNSNLEKVEDKYTEKIESAIISLAETLKTPVEHVYNVLIKQQFIRSITLTAVLVLYLILLIIGVKMGFHSKVDCCDGNIYSIAGVFAFLASFLAFLVMLLGSIPTIVTGFINPEYGALKEILKFL